MNLDHAPQGREAPFSKRPLKWRDVPTILALVAFILGGATVFIDVLCRLNDFETKSSFVRIMYWAFGFSVLWLAWVRWGGWRRAKDRCLDVLGWLYPDLVVYEVDGVHFLVLGWISGPSTPAFRVLLFAQNCHRGSRILNLDLIAKYGSPLYGEEPLRFRVQLGDAGVLMGLATRALSPGPTKGLFEVKASVQVKTSGSRVRSRRGLAPETALMEVAEVMAVAHHPIHSLLSAAVPQGQKKEAPVVLERIPELDLAPWPPEPQTALWSRSSGWQVKGPAHDLLARVSELYGAVARSGSSAGLP
ncbi:MAG TPA: hypothetical protein VKW04_19965 [Planctomycetota bacterium]|nr:hypothetical protein [Planctomycetota bacterium]